MERINRLKEKIKHVVQRPVGFVCGYAALLLVSTCLAFLAILLISEHAIPSYLSTPSLGLGIYYGALIFHLVVAWVLLALLLIWVMWVRGQYLGRLWLIVIPALALLSGFAVPLSFLLHVAGLIVGAFPAGSSPRRSNRPRP